MKKDSLISHTNCGLYCKQGDFYIDPWRGVNKALITHAHSDHARPGSENYLAVKDSENLLKLRLGNDIRLQKVNYGEDIYINGVKVTFFPAGHVLGSSQIRLEFGGEVWVISGDYKTDEDFTCAKFEPVKCTHFITESTFALPIYKWCPQQELFDEINTWWKRNKNNGVTSIIFGYSLGKAQRVISGLDDSIGPIFTHGAVENVNEAYRNSGIKLPPTKYIGAVDDNEIFDGAIIVAPPSADNPLWIKKFKHYSTAFASGWMQVRGNRRRQNIDRGFALSDHADWNGLLYTVKETGAEKIYVTHGFSSSFVKYLCESGYDAETVETEFSNEGEADNS